MDERVDQRECLQLQALQAVDVCELGFVEGQAADRNIAQLLQVGLPDAAEVDADRAIRIGLKTLLPQAMLVEGVAPDAHHALLVGAKLAAHVFRGALAALVAECRVQLAQDGRLDLLVGANLLQDSPGQVHVEFGIRQLRIEAQRLLVGFGGLFEADLRLENIAPQVVVGGFIRDLLDGVIDFGQRLGEIEIFNQLLRLGGKSRRGATQFVEAGIGELLLVERAFLAQARAVALVRELQEKADDHDIENHGKKGKQSDLLFVPAGKEQDVFRHAGPLGLGREAALVRFDVRLQVLDLLVAIHRIEGERLHDHRGEPIRNAFPRAVGEDKVARPFPDPAPPGLAVDFLDG